MNKHQWRVAMKRPTTDTDLIIDIPKDINERLNIATFDPSGDPTPVFMELTDWIIEEFNGQFLPLSIIPETGSA